MKFRVVVVYLENQTMQKRWFFTEPAALCFIKELKEGAGAFIEYLVDGRKISVP